MNIQFRRPAGFTLVEIVIALGVATFCLIAILGLLPVGVQTTRDATSETAANSVLASVIADLRVTPPGSTISQQYQITFGTPKTLYFDAAGQFTTAVGLTSKLRLDVTFPANEGFTHSPTYSYLKVSWPATAPAANASGSIQMFAAFDRN